MARKKLAQVFTVAVAVILPSIAVAENIDPYEDDSQYAWAENVGWLNFEPSQGPGVHVYPDRLEGYLWAENIGWINLSPTTYGGVSNDGAGNLSGYAWGENVGWISFSCENTASCETVDYGVTIDFDGNFAGYAWSENIGWINFNDSHLAGYGVKVCVVNLHDLANFVSHWLETGPDNPADLYPDEQVDGLDYATLAEQWLEYCPAGWPLKIPDE